MPGMKQLLLIVLMTLALPAEGRKQGMELIDSLEAEVTRRPDDTDRIKLLNHIAYLSYQFQPEKGIDHAMAALRMADSRNWLPGEAEAYIAMAANYWAISDYNNTLRCYQSGLDIYTKLGYKKQIAKATAGLGLANFAQHSYRRSIEYFSRCLRIYREMGDSIRAEGVLDNIGSNYAALREDEKALESYNMALHIAKQTANKSAEGQICLNMGDVYKKAGMHDSALQVYNEARSAYRSLKDEKGYSNALLSILQLYHDLHENDECIKLSKKIVGIAKRLNDHYTEAMSEAIAGVSYVALARRGARNTLKQANTHLLASRAAVTKVSDLSSMVGIYRLLTEAYEKQGKYRDALTMQQKYISLSDSLNNTERDKEFTRRDLMYEFGKKEDSIKNVTKLANLQVASLKKEQEVLKLKQRQGTLYTVIAAIALLLGSSVFLSRNRAQQLKVKAELEKERTKKKIRETEYEAKMKDVTFSALRAQMNPHFIFNCLNSIKLYTEQNNTAAASAYLTKFARLIRSTLDNARAEQTTLASEIEMLKLYLEMEAMRFKEKLHYEIIVAEGIDTDFVEIPPLLIQPFVENALWHGIMPKPEGGEVRITIAQSELRDSLLISVTDDGIGREKAMAMKPATSGDHKSYGIKVSAERLALINEKYKTKAEINITDLRDEQGQASGTSVDIKIPIA
ncbi:MAG: histidine kinase [Bacteroidetes bacterium]|nr:histidine kinase [Bacteroidota bacterium]